MLIDYLAQVFGDNLSVFAMLLVGFAVEKHYVSRVTVFTNVIALNLYFLSFTDPPQLLVWYLDAGLVLGVYGMAAYLLSARTSILYNLPAYSFYSSVPVALVIFSPPDAWLAVLISTALISLAVGFLLEDELGYDIAHWGPRPGQVSRFIRTGTMKFYDAEGNRYRIDLDVGFDP